MTEHDWRRDIPVDDPLSESEYRVCDRCRAIQYQYVYGPDGWHFRDGRALDCDEEVVRKVLEE